MYGNIILNQEFSHITDEVVERYAKEREKKILDTLYHNIYIYKSSDGLKLIIQSPKGGSDIELNLTQETAKEIQTKLGLRVLDIPF